MLVWGCSGLLAIEKSVVHNDVKLSVYDNVIKKFPNVSTQNISVEFLNEDALDARITNAKRINVDLLKNDAVVGRRVARVSLYNEKDEFVNYFSLFLKVKAQKKAVVAKNKIQPGKQLTSENTEIRLVEIRNKRSKYFLTNLEDVINKKASHIIRVGEPIYKWSLQTVYDLEKGKLVNAIYKSGELEIGVKAELMESGNIGEKVKVKVKPNNKVLFALVKGKDYVEILSDS